MSRAHRSRSSASSLSTGVALGFALALGACTIGGDDGFDSAYEKARLEVAAPSGVADGYTGVAVAVHGPAGVALALEVTGQGASFVAPDPQAPQKKTVFLEDDGTGEGAAAAAVVSTEARMVTVALEADRVRTARDIDFAPVRLAVGPAVPVRTAPGAVVHEVCVAVNSGRGRLQAESLTVAGEFSPVVVDVRPDGPAGASCPTEPVDAAGWRGYGAFSWSTATDFAQVVMSYRGPDDQSLGTEVLSLRGQAFSGYEVAAGEPVSNESWTSIALSLAYPDAGPLAGGPAAGVPLQEVRFIPESGPTLLGSSSGGAGDPPVTDAAGDVVLFFDTAGLSGTYALFVTPENGATVYVTDLALL